MPVDIGRGVSDVVAIGEKLRDATDLTQSQLQAISAIERICSVLSLVACVLTMVTYCASKSFHKPINRLVFYASFGNMLSNVGTLMSQAYTGRPASSQCQFQAFLIQMFIPADAFWTLAMAVNVYLTFFYKFDAEALRKIELPYLILCYGIPLVPALSYIWVPGVYGDATLWCWISDQWEILRIATFYGPVWLSIVITFVIYIRTGRTIYEKRRELCEAGSFASNDPDSGCESSKITNICVTSKRVTEPTSNDELHALDNPRSFGPNEHYTVSITAEPRRGRFLPMSTCAFIPGSFITPNSPSSLRFHHREFTPLERPSRPSRPMTQRGYDRNNAAWSYTKCSILFFIAILITWVPSSANRLYTVIHNKKHSAPLEFMSAFVLPLQGFWNAAIYFLTSWGACKSLWVDFKKGSRINFWILNRGKSRKNGGADRQDDQRGLGSPTRRIPRLRLHTPRPGSLLRPVEGDPYGGGHV